MERWPNCLQNNYILFHSCQQLIRVSISPNFCQYLLLSTFFILTIPVGEMVSHFGISLHFPDRKILSCIYLTFIHFLGKKATQILCIFLKWVISFYFLLLRAFYIFWTPLYQKHDLQIFSPIWYVVFTFLIMFSRVNFWILMKSALYIFSFVACSLALYPRNHSLLQSQRFTFFFLRNF